MKYKLHLLCTIFLLSSCQHQEKKSIDSLFKKYQAEVAEYIFQYQMSIFPEKDTTALDSALYLIEEALDKGYSKYSFFEIQKLVVLAEQGKYEEAINYVYSLEECLFAEGYPYLEIVRMRFKAMLCHAQNDIVGEKKYLQKIVSVIKSYIEEHRMEIIEYLESSDPKVLLRGNSMLAVQSYFRYSILLHGKEKAILELKDFFSIMSPTAKEVLILPPYEDELKGFYGY